MTPSLVCTCTHQLKHTALCLLHIIQKFPLPWGVKEGGRWELFSPLCGQESLKTRRSGLPVGLGPAACEPGLLFVSELLVARSLWLTFLPTPEGI